MITTEYRDAGPADISIAIVADLHEFEPKPVLSRLSEIRPDVIAVPGDLFENHEFGENLDKEDDSLISRVLCRIIHITNRLAGLRWRQKHRCSKQNAYDFLMKESEIAPVVMSLGNHELYLTEEDKAVLASANVALLNNVYTDQIEHTARRFSAWLPPIQCTLSGHQCMMIIQV